MRTRVGIAVAKGGIVGIAARSSVFMTLVGAVMAPRFGYINPNFAFNPLISFQVVIMAFLGGMQRLWGPVLGVIPLVVLSELLQVQFPYWFSILLGLVFMVIVYVFPRGVTGLVEDGWALLRRPVALPRGFVGSVVERVSGLWRPALPPRGITELLVAAWARLRRRQGA